MLVIFHTWRCFAMAAFSPGVSSHGPRQASSRTQHRHCCWPDRSCCIQAPSSEEQAAQGWHTYTPGGLRGVYVQRKQVLGSADKPRYCFLVIPPPLLPLSCSFSSLETFSPHPPMPGHPSRGYLHDTEPRHFPFPPGSSSHAFPLLFLFTISCEMPLPLVFRVLSLEASLPLTTNPQSSTVSRG